MIYLILAILTTSLGQFFYKLYFNFNKKLYYFLTIFLFAVTPIFSYMALKKLSIDTVYMVTSINIFIVLILSKLFLKETIRIQKIIGAIIIIIGVLIFNLV